MQSVDGCVHAAGGPELRAACMELPVLGTGVADGGNDAALDPVRCRTGSAVVSAVGGLPLCASYCAVVHAVAPFRSDPDWQQLLLSAYQRALSLASAEASFEEQRELAEQRVRREGSQGLRRHESAQLEL